MQLKSKSNKTFIAYILELEIQVRSSGTRGEFEPCQRAQQIKTTTKTNCSILLATFILRQLSLRQNDLFMPELLVNAKVLEVGGGTGVLSTLLAPCVKSWMVTDIAELLPLIQKNHRKNKERIAFADVELAELDWTWTTPQYERNAKQINGQRYDLVLAVDCLYNEALVQPFVQTLNRLNCKYVVVVSELRSAEVLQMFLELWLASGPWTVYRPTAHNTDNLGKEDSTEPGLLGRRHVVWVGWKR
jgi:2-polyprenyl-3-methyl-5-hydroxy-6-metoxy-1,4-benzoquinol methylase